MQQVYYFLHNFNVVIITPSILNRQLQGQPENNFNLILDLDVTVNAAEPFICFNSFIKIRKLQINISVLFSNVT